MNPQGITTGAEQNNGVDKTQETIALYQKAEKIAEQVGTEEAKQQLKELKQVTRSKLYDIQLEISNNLHDLQGDIDFSIGTITEEEYVEVEEEYADVEELLENLPTPDIPEELLGISDTDFANLSTDEAQRVLSFLTDGYLAYPESSWGPASYTNTLSEANSQEDIRIAQQILIDKIHGEGTFERGYADDGMVLGYSAVDGGNFLRTQGDFQNQLESGEIFNALMFANHINYLKSQNGGDITLAFEYIIENSGNRMDRIEAFIGESDNESVSLIKNELIAAELFSPEEGFIGAGFESIKRKGFELLTSGILGFNELIVDSGENIADVLAGIQETLDGSILGFSISSIIGENTLRQIQAMLGSARVKCSAENINTSCFIMSDFIHDIGENLVPDAFRGNIFEQAHNEGVKVLIKKMIETKEVAVSYNSNKGHEVKSLSEFESIVRNDPRYIQQETHKTEVGTYLCGLYKRGENFTPEYLTSVFGEANLFSILSDFKNGDFEGESFDGVSWDEFYSPYLAGFDVAMQGIIRDTITHSNPTQINAVVQGGEGKEDTIATLASCPLCERIDEYDNLTDITIALQSPELREAQPDFYAGLEKKKNHMENGIHMITEELTNLVIEAFGSDEIPQVLQDKISTTAQETFIFMEEYFNQNPESICSIELKKLFLEDNSSPLVAFRGYMSQTYRTNINIYNLIDSSVNTGFTTQINTGESNIQSANQRIIELNAIPENERNQEQITELERLEISIFEWDEDLQILREKQQRAQEIKTSDLVKLNPDTYSLLQELTDNGASNEELLRIIQLYSKVNLAEVYKDPAKYIGQITSKSELLYLLNHSGDEEFQNKLNGIKLIDINPLFRGDLSVLNALPRKLYPSEINDLPESIFRQGSIRDTNQLIGIMKLGIDSNSTVLTIDFTKKILRRVLSATGNPSYGLMLIEKILGDFELTTEEKNAFKLGIPEGYHRSIKERGIDGVPSIEITEEDFLARVDELQSMSSGAKGEDVDYIIKDIDDYIAINSTPSMHLEIIDILIEKRYLSYAPNLLSSVVYSGSNHDGENYYKEQQIALLTSSASNITYFPSDGVSDIDIIATVVDSTQSTNEIRVLMKYLNFSGYNQLETLYNGLVKSYDTKTAQAIIGSDRRFLEIGNKLISTGISNENREFIYGIFRYMSQMDEDFQAGKLEVNSSNSEGVRKRIEEILSGLSLEKSFNDDEVNTLIDAYSENSPSAESIGKIIDIFGNNELAEEFMKEIATSRQQDIRDDINGIAEEITITEENSQIFKDFFEEGIFKSQEFTSALNIFFEEGYEKTDDGLENAIDDYLQLLNLNNEQESKLRNILIKEADAQGWNNLGENTSDFTTAYDEGGTESVEKLITTINQERLESGLPFLTPKEISGEEIFDRVTRKTLPNPDYNQSERKDQPEDENKKSESSSQKSNTLETSSQTSYEISGTTKSPTLSNGNTIIPITQEDLKIISASPELIKDIVRLHGEFLETGLERLWPHKDAIFKSMGNKSGLKFNSKEGYVDKREANELFSTILYITTENPNYKKTGLSLEETKASIIRETHGFAGETNVEGTGEQGNKLEKSFIDKFTMRNQGDEGRFNYTAFSKALKGDFSPNPQ